jgi:hypothetical protein
MVLVFMIKKITNRNLFVVLVMSFNLCFALEANTLTDREQYLNNDDIQEIKTLINNYHGNSECELKLESNRKSQSNNISIKYKEKSAFLGGRMSFDAQSTIILRSAKSITLKKSDSIYIRFKLGKIDYGNESYQIKSFDGDNILGEFYCSYSPSNEKKSQSIAKKKSRKVIESEIGDSQTLEFQTREKSNERVSGDNVKLVLKGAAAVYEAYSIIQTCSAGIGPCAVAIAFYAASAIFIFDTPEEGHSSRSGNSGKYILAGFTTDCNESNSDDCYKQKYRTPFSILRNFYNDNNKYVKLKWNDSRVLYKYFDERNEPITITGNYFDDKNIPSGQKVLVFAPIILKK